MSGNIKDFVLTVMSYRKEAPPYSPMQLEELIKEMQAKFKGYYPPSGFDAKLKFSRKFDKILGAFEESRMI